MSESKMGLDQYFTNMCGFEQNIIPRFQAESGLNKYKTC